MIPQIKLCGTSKQMGNAFGEAFRREIHAFAQSRLTRLTQYIKEYCQIGINENALISRVTTLLPWHQQYDTDIWSEFCGIAEGANISHEMLMITMGYTDLRDYFTQAINTQINDIGECSAFIVPETRSKQGVLCGQTWDMTTEALHYLVIVHRKPNKGPETLYLTTMGCLGLIGLNSYGIAMGNTNLMATDNRPGVHYLFTISRALNATSIDNATGSVINTQRLAGHNFYIADATKAVNIEATARLAYCSLIEDTPHIQTNHYLNHTLQSRERDLPNNIRTNTNYRFERMTHHFTQSNQLWDADACWQTLADDTRHQLGAAICNEDFAGQYSDFATVATVVMIPKERAMWVCEKGAKSGVVQRVGL